MFKICAHQFKLTLSSPRAYIALFFGCVIQIISAMPLLEFSTALGRPLSIFDSFIYFNCDIFTAAAAFLGIVLLVSDIPFSSQNETYTLLRVSRRQWVFGKAIYLLCACVAYYLIVMAVGMLYIAENTYVGNLWSEPLYFLVKNPNSQLATDYSMYFPYSHVLLLTPLWAAAASFGLSVAYSFVMSLFIFWFNLKLPRVISYVFAIMIHVIGYLLTAVFLSLFYVKFSLFGNSLLMYHEIGGYENSKLFTSLPQSFLIYCICGVVLLYLVTRAIRKFDFKITVGTKQ